LAEHTSSMHQFRHNRTGGEVRFAHAVGLPTGATAKSPVGWVGVATSQELALAVVLGLPSRPAAEEALLVSLSRFPASNALAIAWQGQHPVLARLLTYLEGSPEDFSDIPVGIPTTTEFARQVYRQLRRIPWGQVITYGRLAELAGFPQACRAVGLWMKRNLTPILIPCHRVIRSNGTLGGFSPGGHPKCAAEGLRLKEWLLRLERACPQGTPQPKKNQS